jgi:hypothetical protein
MYQDPAPPDPNAIMQLWTHRNIVNPSILFPFHVRARECIASNFNESWRKEERIYTYQYQQEAEEV